MAESVNNETELYTYLRYSENGLVVTRARSLVEGLQTEIDCLVSVNELIKSKKRRLGYVHAFAILIMDVVIFR